MFTMKKLQRELEAEAFAMYKEDEVDYYTIENSNENVYQVKDIEEVLEDLPMDAFMEHVREATSDYYNQR